VDYSLTERGIELAALMLPLVAWIAVHASDIVGNDDDSGAK
jgi:DNA-binding HxlR family transcriptional regulator